MEIDCKTATTVVLTDSFKSKKERNWFNCLPFLSGRVMIDFIVISGLILPLFC